MLWKCLKIMLCIDVTQLIWTAFSSCVKMTAHCRQGGLNNFTSLILVVLTHTLSRIMWLTVISGHLHGLISQWASTTTKLAGVSVDTYPEMTRCCWDVKPQQTKMPESGGVQVASRFGSLQAASLSVVKPMMHKLISLLPSLAFATARIRQSHGLLHFRIMWLSWILCQGASGPVSQWGSTVKPSSSATGR